LDQAEQQAEQYEKLVPLTPEDIRKLKSETSPKLGCVIILIILLTAALVGVWVYLSPFWLQILLMAVAVLLFGVLIFLSINAAIDESKKVQQDLAEGKKKVVISRMESQRMTGHEVRQRTGRFAGQPTGEVKMKYFIKVGGKEYEVSIENYMKLRPGQFIEIHRTVHSDKLLYLGETTGLIDPATAVSPQR
jgi:hypothetical protein